MSARLNFGTCPHCGNVRNMAGMTAHIKRAHPQAVIQVAA